MLSLQLFLSRPWHANENKMAKHGLIMSCFFSAGLAGKRNADCMVAWSWNLFPQMTVVSPRSENKNVEYIAGKSWDVQNLMLYRMTMWFFQLKTLNQWNHTFMADCDETLKQNHNGKNPAMVLCFGRLAPARPVPRQFEGSQHRLSHANDQPPDVLASWLLQHIVFRFPLIDFWKCLNTSIP